MHKDTTCWPLPIITVTKVIVEKKKNCHLQGWGLVWMIKGWVDDENKSRGLT